MHQYYAENIPNSLSSCSHCKVNHYQQSSCPGIINTYFMKINSELINNLQLLKTKQNICMGYVPKICNNSLRNETFKYAITFLLTESTTFQTSCKIL